MAWTHDKLYQGKRSYRERHNYARAIRRAARARVMGSKWVERK
jgi:hypothetical protein